MFKWKYIYIYISWILELRQGSPEKFPRPYEFPWFSLHFLQFLGGGLHPVNSRMSFRFLPSGPNVTFSYERLSLTFLCRSLMPRLERFWKLSLTYLCRLLHSLEAGNLRLCEALFGLLVLIGCASLSYSGHEGSRWLLHAKYLLYAKIFFQRKSGDINFQDSATDLCSTPYGW